MVRWRFFKGPFEDLTEWSVVIDTISGYAKRAAEVSAMTVVGQAAARLRHANVEDRFDVVLNRILKDLIKMTKEFRRGIGGHFEGIAVASEVDPLLP